MTSNDRDGLVDTTQDDTRKDARGSSRRRFLRNVGLSAGAAAVGGSGIALTPKPSKAAGASSIPARGDRFTRMFELPPFALDTKPVNDALLELGKRGGIMDANDDLSAGPVRLITDPAVNGSNGSNADNPTHTAGTTFVGQFIDHDITFDATSPLGQPTAPERTPNGRSARFDLDSVYGNGPTVDSQLYQRDSSNRVTAKLVVESGGRYEDLPRTADGTAVLGDPRNDENLIISGLQIAALKFHNNAVDRLRGSGDSELDVFAKARRFTTWHYQWLVVHQFLPQFVGQAMVDDVLRNGRKIYRPKGEPAIPVEFSGAAYRFGHSMVRPSYRANFTGNPGNSQFFGFIFDPSDDSQTDPDDLRGGHRAERRFIGWHTFFDFGDGKVRRNKLIDPTISSPLMNLPLPVIPGHSGPTSLAQRNLLRHLTWSLPSGQDIARAVGATPLARGDLPELSRMWQFDKRTPLWYYVLKEAKVVNDGHFLGPVGGRIVAEVFIGLMQLDDDAYLAAQPNWTPDLGSDFKMTDWLAFAGVDANR